LHYVHPVAGGPLVMVSIVLALWAGIGRMRSLLAAGVALGLVETLGVAWSGPGWRETLVAAVLLFTLLARGGSLARGMTAGGRAG
jgi:branched-chain amino acid transport system permease protein